MRAWYGRRLRVLIATACVRCVCVVRTVFGATCLVPPPTLTHGRDLDRRPPFVLQAPRTSPPPHSTSHRHVPPREDRLASVQPALLFPPCGGKDLPSPILLFSSLVVGASRVLPGVRRGPEARDDLAVRYSLTREELVDAFGSARDDWIENDFQGWLGANTFYEVGVRGLYSLFRTSARRDS